MKKFIAILLFFVMLASISPAVAAENAPEKPKPTVDEILNDYHRKSFETQLSTQTGAVTYSDRSSEDSKTLEQETVDTLVAAGYQAYNVTSDNFDSLESSLATDFEQMDMQKGGSYVIVVGGDELTASLEPQTRAAPGPMQDHFDDGGSSMEYVYNGTTYKLRYVIVTSAMDPMMSKSATVDLLAPSMEHILAENVLNAAIGYGLDYLTAPIHLGTIASICGIQYVDLTPNSFAQASLYATATWTRLYTEVYDETWCLWMVGSMVEYAAVTYNLACTAIVQGNAYVYDPDEVYFALYTEHYNDVNWKKHQAVIGVLYADQKKEYVGNISIVVNSGVVHTFRENF